MSDDLTQIARDLIREATVTPLEARGVVQRGCLNIKRDWRERASGIKHAPRYPQSITYDTRVLAGSVIGEIGPENGTGDSDHQGFLGEVLELGGAHNAPRNDGAAALAAETPRFEAALAALAGRHLER